MKLDNSLEIVSERKPIGKNLGAFVEPRWQELEF